jgi:hypothetical protein
MLTVANAETRRACAVVAALEEHEITSGECAEALAALSPEALQVMATMLGQFANQLEGDRHRRLMRARAICLRLVALRCWN